MSATTLVKEFCLPGDITALEEINLPPELASDLAGQTMKVNIVPEEMPATRQVDRETVPCLIAPDGTHWNCYSPMQVSFHDDQGSVRRIPRHWISNDIHPKALEPDISYNVTGEHVFSELLIFPTAWDLAEINFPVPFNRMRAGQVADGLEVILSSNQPVRLYWTGYDRRWRIPRNWRRRRIRLPTGEVLTAQGVPLIIAAKSSGKVVTVNYHVGSLCCLPQHYRFRDGRDGPWAVRIEDCVLVGFGGTEESRA